MAGQQKVISSTFNVSTVDETVSLQAQYAPNDNPTSSQIHNTWQEGDLYMRTKMTDETTWSDWHKIVGENGGETDFSFAISSNATSTNSSTPPSDCTSESSWHDTPQAVTSQKPYLWMRIKKKVWNESTQQYDVSSTSYARLSAESNYIADLDNEMDSIECNNLGYPKSAQTISTKATLYRGSTLLSSTIAVYDDNTSGAQYTNGTAKDGITISWNNTTGVINVAFATSTIRTEKEEFCIKLTATDSGQTIERLLYLTVNCVRGTALYRLVPSTDTITKRKNGTLVPSGNITCDVQKIVNGVISTPAASEYSLTMKVDDGTEQSYASIAISSITSNIEYILRVPQTSGTIVDRERIPLLIDGIDGTSITGANVWYALTTSDTTTPQDSAFTLDEFPTTLNAGYYIWQATKVTFSTGNPVFTGKMCLGATTDFLSGTEVYAISTSNSTAPADNQFGTTYNKTKGYYLWTATRVQYTNGNYAYLNKKCVGYWGEDGQNAFVVDLENEMKNVALTEGGNTLTAVDFYFKVQAFYGTTNVLTDNECTVSASCSDSNVRPTTTAAKTTGIRVEVAQNVALANSTDITVTVAHTTYGTRTVVFTLAGVRGGKNAVLQELLPSRDNITFARLASGGLTPSSRDLTLSIKKTQGDVTTIQNISASGLTIKWDISSMPASSDSGYIWGYGSSTGITWSDNNTTMQIANTVEATNIYIAAFNSDGILVDRETIPVIKDGNNGNDGDDAPAAFADPDKISVQCNPNPNGSVTASQTTNVIFSLKVGTHNATVTSVSSGTKPTGVTVTGQADNAVTITIGTTATASGISSGVTFTVNGTYDNKNYSAKVTVALIGSKQGEPGGTGARGKVGRFFYYAGEWDDFSSSSEFDVTDVQAPYFHYANDDNYWVFNPESNGTYIKSNMGTPDSSNPNWKLMQNDFKYIITEAIFGSYAHFGACVINGDWLISIHGKIDGNVYTGTIDNPDKYNNAPAYTYFDPMFPLGTNVSDNVLPKTVTATNLQKIAVGVYSDLSVDYEKINDELYALRAGTYWFKARMRVNNANYSGFLRLFKDGMAQNYAISTNSTTEIVIRSSSHYLTSGEYYFTALILYTNNFEGYTQVYQITNSRNSTLVDNYNNKRYVPIYCKANSMPNPPSSLDPNNLDGGWTRDYPQGTGSNTYVVFGIIPLANYESNPQLIINDIEFEIPEGDNGRFAPNYAVDLRRGKSYQNDAYIRGEIHASRGTFTGTITANDGNIGGFSIGEKELTNADWQAGIDIAADSKVVKIGENAKGAMNTEDAILRAENTKTKSLSSDTYNTALYLNAQGAKYNYAFYGNGNGVLNGLVFGFKVNALSVAGSSDATYNLDLKDGATVIFTGSRTSGTASAYMPKISDIRKALGITSTSVKFAFEYALSNQTSGSGTVKLIFRSYPNGNSEYPYRTNFDNNYTGNNYELPMATGDYAKILLIWDGSEYKAFVIRYIDGGWGAND